MPGDPKGVGLGELMQLFTLPVENIRVDSRAPQGRRLICKLEEYLYPPGRVSVSNLTIVVSKLLKTSVCKMRGKPKTEAHYLGLSSSKHL